MTKKVILFLVEGPTDEDALAVIFTKLVNDHDIEFDVLHTDITADENMTVICSVAEGISAYFFIYQKRCWDLVYLCTALTLAIILLLRQAIKISRRIMEAENCYMALEEDSLAVCQPEKNGKYESCRIFYDEMDKIVEGTRRGIPEFYIVIRKEGKEQKSFFLLDEEEQERDVFCVRSFGFDNQGFMEFYRKLRWIVPGRTRIIGTKTQEVWKLRRPNIGICTAAGMLLGYVLPKLLEMMYG